MKSNGRRPWLGFVVAYLTLCMLALWPAITIVNRPVLVFGLPLLMVWSFVIALGVTVVLLIADKMGVH